MAINHLLDTSDLFPLITGVFITIIVYLLFIFLIDKSTFLEVRKVLFSKS